MCLYTWHFGIYRLQNVGLKTYWIAIYVLASSNLLVVTNVALVTAVWFPKTFSRWVAADTIIDTVGGSAIRSFCALMRVVVTCHYDQSNGKQADASQKIHYYLRFIGLSFLSEIFNRFYSQCVFIISAENVFVQMGRKHSKTPCYSVVQYDMKEVKSKQHLH